MFSKFWTIYFISCIFISIYGAAIGDSKEEANVEHGESSTESSKEGSPKDEKEPNEEEKELEKEIKELGKEIEEKLDEDSEMNPEKNEETTEEPETEPEEKEKENEEEAVKNNEEIITSKVSTVSEEKSEDTSSSPMLVTVPSIEKEEAPKDAFVVWNSKGKICLLAKFEAIFTITYSSQGGEETAEISIPKTVNSKGKCESTSISPLLQISWQKYTFAMMFNKSNEENWVVTSMDFTYDTAEPLFDRATNAGKKTARSKALTLFETPCKKSYVCNANEVVSLYTGNKKVVNAKLYNIHLQPYGVEDGKFSTAHHCNKVVLDGPGETFVQDETIPLAVGLTLALITLFILIGFSAHRAYNAAKVDYNTVE